MISLPIDHLGPSNMYRPGKQLAHGGMGAVLEATDANLGRLVAMKVMLAGKSASRENRLRFIQEARVLSQLEHPNIVPIYEMGLNEAGQVFYTMKLVKGRTLHEVLEEVKAGKPEAPGEFSLAKLLTIFQKICDAVSFAHSLGVIHRDLKPGNIMLGGHGEVLVMDWGLAKILSPEPAVSESIEGFQETLCEDSHGNSQAKGGAGLPLAATGKPPAPASLQSGEGVRTMEGRIMGTPNFMAPEQAEGRVGEIDGRTDIFALGGILYNLLTLRVPAEGATAGEVLDKIKRGYIAPPVYYNRAGALEPDGAQRKQPLVLAHCPGKKVPEALSAVAMKAMSQRPQERYQSVEELQNDITAYQTGFATMAELPGPVTLMRLWFKRHKPSFAIAASVSAFLIVASMVVILMWLELRGTAPVFFDKAQALVSQQRFAEALAPIGYAIQKMPKRQAYWVLKGNILESLLRLEEAKTAYQHALGLQADHAAAKQNLGLCERILKDNPGRRDLAPANLVVLQSAMRSQGRKEEADALLRRLLAQDQAQRTVFYRQWRKQLDQARMGGDLRIDESGRVELDLQGRQVVDLSPTRGIPLNFLGIRDTQVKTLSPLRGMRLERLSISNAPDIGDLTPLKGMALRELRLDKSSVTNLAPLVGMPLESLWVNVGAISDIRPLQGMLIQSLALNWCPISNLSPLRGMPLKDLALWGTSVTDLHPVLGSPMETLHLAYSRVFTDFWILTNLPVAHLCLTGMRIKDLSPLARLKLHDLSLAGCPVSDLRPLSGLPLNDLDLSDTQVSDLTPLIAAPLSVLHLDSTKVVDLRPLRGKSITSLSLAHTQVTDLSPVQDLPLDELWLDGCTGLKDLGPLTNMTHLRSLTIPTQSTNIDFLRRLPNLQQLGYSRSLLLPPAEFWKMRDKP